MARTATKLRVLCYKSMRAPWARNDWILQVIDKLARRGKASSGCGALILVGTLLLSACGGGGSTQGPVATATSSNSGGSSPVSPSSMSSGSGASIPATFFALSDTNPNDPPTVSHGTLGRPQRLAWTEIEQTKGSFDFSFLDAYASIAPKDADGTANMVLTLGMTPPWATSDQSKCRTFAEDGPQLPLPPSLMRRSAPLTVKVCWRAVPLLTPFASTLVRRTAAYCLPTSTVPRRLRQARRTTT